MGFQRSQVSLLRTRLAETRRFIQVVAGPRQVGKSTMVQQALDGARVSHRYASADEPTLRGPDWIEQQWEMSRLHSRETGSDSVLVLDELQKIPGWSEVVKRLWDEDTRRGVPVKVILLGSAPLLISRGTTESLAGRFEVVRMPHWSFAEMRSAFGFDLDEYLYFGGYPGAAALIGDPDRWRRYVRDSLIETSVARDVLLLTRVDKPALLRRLFELSARYSGQILSYSKMIGQLTDAGNTTTLAHYLDLIEGAGLLRGLQKFAGDAARRRGSSPKLQVYNTALMTAVGDLDLAEAKADREYWGRLSESAVGAHFANAAACGECEVYYWRDQSHEVDFVLKRGSRIVAVEVKSTRARHASTGTGAFAKAFGSNRKLLVGGDGIPLTDVLTLPVARWFDD